MAVDMKGNEVLDIFDIIQIGKDIGRRMAIDVSYGKCDTLGTRDGSDALVAIRRASDEWYRSRVSFDFDGKVISSSEVPDCA